MVELRPARRVARPCPARGPEVIIIHGVGAALCQIVPLRIPVAKARIGWFHAAFDSS